jgi:peptidoglycan/xylan/chitin deacetylase (PgdA/CDA1 family)
MAAFRSFDDAMAAMPKSDGSARPRALSSAALAAADAAPDTSMSDARPIPILLYHCVADDPDPWIRRFAIAPRAFERQLDLVAAHGATTLTVSELVDTLAGGAALPERPVLITFDDGFADFRDAALPALRVRGMAATLYPTTGFLDGRSPGGGRMLGRRDLPELAAAGAVEVGGHTHTHPQLDAVAGARARDEIERCKGMLEDALGAPVRSFAYPHGYSSAGVRAMVRAAGFDSACAVKNALSSTADDRFALARLIVRDDTPLERVDAWLAGGGAPMASRREAARTRAARVARRTRAALRRERAAPGGRARSRRS